MLTSRLQSKTAGPEDQLLALEEELYPSSPLLSTPSSTSLMSPFSGEQGPMLGMSGAAQPISRAAARPTAPSMASLRNQVFGDQSDDEAEEAAAAQQYALSSVGRSVAGTEEFLPLTGPKDDLDFYGGGDALEDEGGAFYPEGGRFARPVSGYSPAGSVSLAGLTGHPGSALDLGGRSGRQRRQGRKPAATASAEVSWKSTLRRRAGRAAQEGRQNTPVLATE